MSEKLVTGASYAGGIVSVLSAMTLNDFGVLVGILTALATVCMNLVFRLREDRRQQQAHAAGMARLAADRRQRNEPVAVDRRRQLADCPPSCPYGSRWPRDDVQ